MASKAVSMLVAEIEEQRKIIKTLESHVGGYSTNIERTRKEAESKVAELKVNRDATQQRISDAREELAQLTTALNALGGAPSKGFLKRSA